MRILNVNSYYFSSSVYKPMEEALLIYGYDIITYIPVSNNYYVRDECRFELPSHIDISECYNNIDRIIFHLKHWKIRRDFLNRYNFNKFDILHAHSLFSNGYIAYCTYKKYNIPYIVAVRDTDVNVFFKKMPHLRKLGLNILINAHKIVFLSKTYRDHCIKYIPRRYKLSIEGKAVVIPNGIDKFWIQNKLDITKTYSKRMVKLIFAGNVTKRKNLETLLKACEILRQRNYNVKLIIVGKIMNKRIGEKLKMANFVQMIGRVDQKKLLQLYRQNDIFVMPSITETFGLVYPEAMSQGLPVIYTRGQGFDGHFNEGEVGYSVNCMDANEIADKIIKIRENYNEISNRCIKLVNKFDWNNIVKDYKTIYDSIKN